MSVEFDYEWTSARWVDDKIWSIVRRGAMDGDLSTEYEICFA